MCGAGSVDGGGGCYDARVVGWCTEDGTHLWAGTRGRELTASIRPDLPSMWNSDRRSLAAPAGWAIAPYLRP